MSADAFAGALERAGARGGEVAFVLVDRRGLRRLSRRFRGEDHDTDVLSFDYREAGERRGGRLWGDVVVSADAARAQARERGIPVREELARLFLHGALHLLGYRDGTPREERRMWRVQEELLRELLRSAKAPRGGSPRSTKRRPSPHGATTPGRSTGRRRRSAQAGAASAPGKGAKARGRGSADPRGGAPGRRRSAGDPPRRPGRAR